LTLQERPGAVQLTVLLRRARRGVAQGPEAVVALGATAAQALLGPDFRVTRSRGKVFPWPASGEEPAEFPDHNGAFLVATIHPSAVLRADHREIAYRGLVEDLTVVSRTLAAG
jgi:DNA polymerase